MSNEIKKYIQTDELQKFIDWENIMKMERYSGGHDDQMKGLFKGITVVAHWNEGNYSGQVATCVKFNKGKFKNRYAIYNDYYGSCSGCDSWEGASDEEIRRLCILLSNSTYLFKNINDIKEFLQNPGKENYWTSWNGIAEALYNEILKSQTNEQSSTD